VFQFSRGNLYADTNKKNFADGSSIFGRNGACPRDRHASAWQVFMYVCIYYVYLSLSSSLSHSSAWQVLCVSVYSMCVCVYYGHLSLSSFLICMAGFMCVCVFYVCLCLLRASLSVFFSHLHGRFYVCQCILCISLSVFLSHTLICMAGFMCVCVYYGVATVSRISFAEYRLFFRALLQKRPIILSILLTKATPRVHVSLSLSLTHSSAWQVWQALCASVYIT